MNTSQIRRIFISYRRTDSAGYAGRIYDRLTNHFGKVSVFMDVATIPAGYDFVKFLQEAVQSCDVLVVLISRQWISIKDESGKRRLDNLDDFVRVEVAAALDRDIRVIPVLVDGTNMPRPTELPDNMKPLARRNALQIHHYSFDADVNRLIAQLELALKIDESERESQPTSVAVSPPNSQRKSTSKKTWSVTGIASVLVLLMLFIWGGLSLWGNRINNNPQLTQMPHSTVTVTVEPINTNTSLPANTLVPSPATPTQGNNSTMRGMDDMVLIVIPSGEFLMGSAGTDADERPVHPVYLEAYLIDQTEVTNEMYAECVEDQKCEQPRDNTSIGQNKSNNSFYFGNPKFNNYPVIYVSRDDAMAYCLWVDRRLPTESEWEKAASWDDTLQEKRIYPWGNTIDCTQANFWGDGDKLCVGDTTSVGSYPKGASFYGVLDMAGNVSEWVVDRYDPEAYDDPDYSDPTGPLSGDNFVVRGGSFLVGRANEVRSSDRDYHRPDYTSYSLGFRCAMDAP